MNNKPHEPVFCIGAGRIPSWCVLSLLFLLLISAMASASDLLISEFMADNGSTLADEDGDFSDWIEIVNVSSGSVDLNGWYLTNDSVDLTKWIFPSVTLEPGEYLVVFASEKDRRNPGSELHTNFNLNKDGDYLALVMPDGVTVAQEFAPTYPVQKEDFSYGIIFSATPLIEEGASVDVLVPSDGLLGITWTGIGFTVDGSWTNGVTGVGFLAAPGISVADELLVDLDAAELSLGTVSS